MSDSRKARTSLGVTLCLAGVAMAAGISPLVRYAVHYRGLDPILFGGMWLLSAGVWAFLVGRVNRREPALNLRRAWPHLLLVGLIHIGTGVGAFVGFVYVSAAIGAFLINMSVPMAFCLGLVILKEKATRLRLLGVGLAVAGLPAFLLPGRAGQAIPSIGVALLLGSAMCSASLDLVAKVRFQRLPMWALVCARGIVPGSCFIIFSRFIRHAAFPDADLAVLVVVGALFGPCLGFYLIYLSLRYVPLTVASTLRATMPVLTAGYAALALGETIGWARTGGALMIIAGAALAPLGQPASVRSGQ